jgi:3-methyladenine DNA glycosylase AlkD
MSTMKVTRFTQEIVATLSPLAQPERAIPMRRYMRDKFDFLGIQTPVRRVAAAPLIRAFKPENSAELIGAARSLWRHPEREYQYVAVDLLARHWKCMKKDDLPALLDLAQRKSWWDSVDALAGVVGDIVRKGRGLDPEIQQEMDRAVRSGNLWVRRIAMLHQLGWRGETDAVRLFSYATELAPEGEFFIQKAIGWALRDYAKHDRAAVQQYLQKMRGHLSALSHREASKHEKNKMSK